MVISKSQNKVFNNCLKFKLNLDAKKTETEPKKVTWKFYTGNHILA